MSNILWLNFFITLEAASRVRPVTFGLLRSAETSCEFHSKTLVERHQDYTNGQFQLQITSWHCKTMVIWLEILIISTRVGFDFNKQYHFNNQKVPKLRGKTWRLHTMYNHTPWTYIYILYICTYYIYISWNTTNKLWRKHTQTHQYGVPHVGNTIGKEYKATYLFHSFSILYDTLHDSGMPKVVPLVDSSMVESRIKRWETHLSSYCDEKKHDINTQTFNVWYTYLHLLNFYGKCR